MQAITMLYPFHVNGVGESTAPAALARAWRALDCDVRLVAPSVEQDYMPDVLCPALSGLARSLLFRLGGERRLKRFTEEFFLSHVDEDSVAYLWAGGVVDTLFQVVKERGALIVYERNRCVQSWLKPYLDQAYEQAGLRPEHGVTSQSIAREEAKLALADIVVSPGQSIERSLRESGVAPEKIISSAYGWDPETHPNAGRRPHEFSDAKTFLFVGEVSIRNGAHMLLDAWLTAGEPGELVLLGELEDALERTCSGALCKGSVRRETNPELLQELYLEADFLLNPCLDDNGALSMYAPMAHGVIPLATPMGGGSVIRPEHREGLILPPNDPEAWAQAIYQIARQTANDELGEMSQSVVKRAQNFTWSKVAQQRLEKLVQRLNMLK